MKRRHWLQGAAALALAGPLALRVRAEAPAPYDTLDLDWTDPARGRPVPVRLYRPQAMVPGARVPLIVFSHGIGGSRRGYSWLGRFVAAHGIASLHLQHVGSDRSLWGGRVDTTRIVAAGHSYGANTSLLVSGAQVPGVGEALADPRVRAAIVMSAPPFYGEPEPRRILQGVTVPTLHVTCTDDVIRIPGYWSGFDDRVQVFEATGSARKWLAVYEGGSHSIFTDRAGTGGVQLNPQVKQATRELALAFLRGVFDGDEAALAQWPQRHAGILARFEAA